jgi:uncharacterized protein
MEHKEIRGIEEILNELKDDVTVPKNVRIRVENVMGILKEKDETHIKISKALNELEEVADDVNLQSYTRTQIWNIISLLEKINEA